MEIGTFASETPGMEKKECEYIHESKGGWREIERVSAFNFELIFSAE